MGDAVVLNLWRGELIQKNNEHHDIDCEYHAYLLTSFLISISRCIISRNSGLWLLGSPRPVTYWRTTVSTRIHVSDYFCSLAVRYQNFFRILVWLFFLAVYSQAGKCSCIYIKGSQYLMDTCACKVREPLEKLGPNQSTMDGWEILMYIMALAFTIEGEPPSSVF